MKKKYDDIIYEEEVYCTGVRRSIRESIPVEILEPKWDNKKSYLQLIKGKKVTFEDDIPNMKTNMNNNLLTHTIENSKHMTFV